MERNLKRQEISSTRANFRCAMKFNTVKRGSSDFLQISSTRADSSAIAEGNATTAQKENEAKRISSTRADSGKAKHKNYD